MRVFVYEYASAVGTFAEPQMRPWLAEGWAMLTALLGDFCSIPNCEVATIIRERWPAARTKPQNLSIESTDAAFPDLARAADWTLVVAPECDDILENLSRSVLHNGGALLGSTPAAIRLTGDKLTLSHHLRRQAIPTPPTWLDDEALAVEDLRYPLVRKPRQGAGSVATFLLSGYDDLARIRSQSAANSWRGEMTVQPLIPGFACSVAVLASSRGRVVFPPMTQILSTDGRFNYRGGDTRLNSALCERATNLAAKTLETVDGLRGFVGVDLVLGPAADGDHVIEINPRVTTSYVGLRVALDLNIAEAMVRLAIAEPIPVAAPGLTKMHEDFVSWCVPKAPGIDAFTRSPPASGGEGWGEGGQDARRRHVFSRGDSPLTPNPSRQRGEGRKAPQKPDDHDIRFSSAQAGPVRRHLLFTKYGEVRCS